MKKRKITRLEALKLQRRLVAESKGKTLVRAQSARHLKKENEDDVFVVVTMDADDATVKFQDGNMLVGPFDSEEAAQSAAGEDVVTVTGGEVGAAGAPAADDGVALEPELHEGRRMASNFLRTRRRVAESVARSVLARIRRESDALAGVKTDVKNGDEATDKGEAGVTDMTGVASFVNAADLGPNELKTPTDSDPAAKNSDENVLESHMVGAGMLVNVTIGGRKVDTGVVESVRGGKVVLEGGIDYDAKTHQFERLAS